MRACASSSFGRALGLFAIAQRSTGHAAEPLPGVAWRLPLVQPHASPQYTRHQPPHALPISQGTFVCADNLRDQGVARRTLAKPPCTPDDLAVELKDLRCATTTKVMKDTDLCSRVHREELHGGMVDAQLSQPERLAQYPGPEVCAHREPHPRGPKHLDPFGHALGEAPPRVAVVKQLAEFEAERAARPVDQAGNSELKTSRRATARSYTPPRSGGTQIPSTGTTHP